MRQFWPSFVHAFRLGNLDLLSSVFVTYAGQVWLWAMLLWWILSRRRMQSTLLYLFAVTSRSILRLFRKHNIWWLYCTVLTLFNNLYNDNAHHWYHQWTRERNFVSHGCKNSIIFVVRMSNSIRRYAFNIDWWLISTTVIKIYNETQFFIEVLDQELITIRNVLYYDIILLSDTCM